MNTTATKLFLVFGLFRNQNVWTRQLDIEGDIEDRADVEAKLVNDGGAVWILGFKTEDDGAHIVTRNGGRTELLGALHVGGATQGPRYITEDAFFSAAVNDLDRQSPDDNDVLRRARLDRSRPRAEKAVSTLRESPGSGPPA